MENYINKIFERAHIKNIRRFLLEGREADEDTGTYEERIDSNSEDIIYTLIRLIKNKNDSSDEKLDDAMDNLTTALLTYRDVFTEIGMKIGAKLLFQLLFQNE